MYGNIFENYATIVETVFFCGIKTIWLLHDTIFARVQATPRFLGQEFGNNNNSCISCTRFYQCESKTIVIAFATLWLSLQHFW
jgi:hypothetical protein